MKTQRGEECYQSKLKRLCNYVKRTFYYDYYTYNIAKSPDIVKDLLLAYFKKLDDNKCVGKLYGELPDEDSLYIEYIRQSRSNIPSSPTCIKGRFYADKTVVQ